MFEFWVFWVVFFGANPGLYSFKYELPSNVFFYLIALFTVDGVEMSTQRGTVQRFVSALCTPEYYRSNTTHGQGEVTIE